jgi:pimeloyl-ACP methyl ester carboxylesterase
MERRWWVVLALVLGGCLAPRTLLDVLNDTGPTERRGDLSVAPIDFAPLEGGAVRAERGRLDVPVARLPAGSGTLSIHYVRLPARTSTPGSPIVYLAGGPGGSGTASAAGDRYPLFARLRDVADVIALDQRGTWNAEPYMVCPGSWSYPASQELTEAALARAVGPWVAECHRHWSERGVDLDAFNTRESAADLEALRVALGAERLNLLAISYGTHLALEFARSFPQSVDRMILAGTEGLDHTLKSPTAIGAALQRIDAYLAELGIEPLTSRAQEGVERLKGTVATGRVGGEEVVLGELDARITIFGGAGERQDLFALTAGLDAALEGDYGPAAEAILDWRRENVGLAMSLAMDCASWGSPERLRAIDAEAATSFLGDAANMLLRAQCASWPGGRLPVAYHRPVRSDAPTLFISGALDVRTPIENALEVAQGFTTAWHLVIADGGHDDDLLIAAPETGRIIQSFLAGEDPGPPMREIRIGGAGPS